MHIGNDPLVVSPLPKSDREVIDIEGYEGQTVPAYYLWHPSDHYGATLNGSLGTGDVAATGANIHIQETMQYLKYGWKYPVDSQLKIYYCEKDGWAMGKEIPVLGKIMMLRIHFEDVVEGDAIEGVHYHYEIVIGVNGRNPFSRFANRKVGSHFSTEFFEAWHLHNAIEVGTFENFLPAIYQQREDKGVLEYSRGMNSISNGEPLQVGFDRTLFERRVQGYQEARDVHQFQAWDRPSFLGSAN